MVKWDYLVLTDLELLQSTGSTDLANDVVKTECATKALQKLGQEGWEHYVVASEEFPRHYFKRPIPVGATRDWTERPA